ncbi:MAG: hypothetical protein ACJ8NS_06780 [Chthoniobacterales bacterium]
MPEELPFLNNVPARYYEMALDEARSLLSPSDEPLISIKIRPIDKWPIASPSDFRNRYVYPSEYSQLEIFLSRFTAERRGDVSRGKAIAFTAGSGQEFLFVEHETGPEIVLYLGVITAGLGLAKAVIDLVAIIIKTINDSNAAKKAGKASGRHYEANAISIEERTATHARIVKVISLPIADKEVDREKLMKELLRSLDRDNGG